MPGRVPAGGCRPAPVCGRAVGRALRQPRRRPGATARTGRTHALAVRLQGGCPVCLRGGPTPAGLRMACRIAGAGHASACMDRRIGRLPWRHGWTGSRCVHRSRMWVPAAPAGATAQRRIPPSRRASASGRAAPSSCVVSGSTGRRPDAASTVEPAVRNLAAMVGDLLSATTRPAATRGAARPHAVSASPAAHPTRAGRAQARQRPAPGRHEIPHRSRPPPRRRVIPFAFRPAKPRVHAYVGRERPLPRASRPVHRLSFERRPPPRHPATPISGAAHRPTLVPGPFLLQISTPMD